MAVEYVEVGTAYARPRYADQDVGGTDLGMPTSLTSNRRGSTRTAAFIVAILLSYFTVLSLARSIVKAMAPMRTMPKTICCCVASISK